MINQVELIIALWKHSRGSRIYLWWTVYALTRVLFWCLLHLLLRNSGNKHQNNPLVSTYKFATQVHTLCIYNYVFILTPGIFC